MPLALARELQQAGYSLPRNSVNAYEAGALTLATHNGDPTAPIPIQRLEDGQTGNPLDRSGALSRRGFLSSPRSSSRGPSLPSLMTGVAT